jgi:hypothetical protein
MKEKRIEIVHTENIEPELNKVNRFFIDKEFLKQKDIDKMAQLLAESIKRKIPSFKNENEEIEFVLDVLKPEHILSTSTPLDEAGFFVVFIDPLESIHLEWEDEKGVTQTDIIKADELEPFLQKIRISVLDRLSGFLPENVKAQMISRLLKGKAFELEGGKIYKRPLRGTGRRGSLREDAPQIEALKYLHDLPEKSPFIYYGTESFDTHTGNTISKAIKLYDVERALSQERLLSFPKILSCIMDVIEGHKFLLSKGLILSDNTLDNLGINMETERGILFDFDGLGKLGTRLYPSKPKFGAPELFGATELEKTPTEKTVVYELGQGIFKIIDTLMGRKANKDQQIALGNLAHEMTEKEPSMRPSLDEVQKRLREIVQQVL